MNAQQLVDLLSSRDGLNARELSSLYRQRYAIDVHKRDINPILYAHQSLFERRGDSPPIWYLKQKTGARPQGTAVSDVPSAVQPVRAHTPSPIAAPSRVSTPAEVNPAPSVPSAQPRSTPQEPRSIDDTKKIANKLLWPLPTLDPYDWQADAFHWWTTVQYKGIVEAVTGTGKTSVGLAAIASARKAGKRVLLLVPSIVLQEQWARRIKQYMPSIEIDYLGGRSPGSSGINGTHQVLVAVINSAASYADQLDGKYPVVVADECHRYGANSFQQALLQSASWRLGLTATLERMDEGVEQTLRPYFTDATYTYDFDRATSDRVLASFVVANLGIPLSEEERAEYNAADELCRKARGTLIHQYEYPVEPSAFFAKATEAAKKMMTLFGEGKYAKQFMVNFSRRIKVLADTPARLDALRKLRGTVLTAKGTLAFTETVDAADSAAQMLRSIDVKASAYHSGIDTRAREQSLTALRDGELNMLVGVKALDEGVDVPDVNLGIIMSASHQKRQMIQRLGRIVRKKSDGRYAVLVNFFATDTSEDPRNGNHEAFINAIRNGADEIETFADGCTPELFQFLDKYLNDKALPIADTPSKAPPSPIQSERTAEVNNPVLEPEPVRSEVTNERIATLIIALQEATDKAASQSRTIDRLKGELASMAAKNVQYQEHIDKLTVITEKLQTLVGKLLGEPKSIDNKSPLANAAQKTTSNQSIAKSSATSNGQTATQGSSYSGPPGYYRDGKSFQECRQCGGDGGAGGRCPRCGGNGIEPRDYV